MLKIITDKAFKLFFLFVLFNKLSLSQAVYSDKEQSTFSFTLGMTSTGCYRDTIKYSQGILFNGGFVYILSVSDKSNIGIEALFSGKAFKSNSPFIKYRFSFVDLPLYYQYKLSSNIRANLGIQYSKYISSQYYYLDGSKTTGVHKEPLTTNIGDDMGVLVGGEFGIAKNLFVTARYTISANSFFKSNSPYLSVFQFSFKWVVYRGYKQIFNRKNGDA